MNTTRLSIASLILLVLLAASAQAGVLSGYWTSVPDLQGACDAVMVDADDNIYVQHEGTLYRSSDYGAMWSVKVGQIDAELSRIAMREDGTFFAAARDGAGLFSSSDGAEHWKKTGLDGIQILSLAFSRGGLVLCGTEMNDVVASADNGFTWYTIFDQSLRTPVRQITVAPSGDIYVATELGMVYRSSDEGASWQSISNGLPDDPVIDLVVTHAGSLFAVTKTGGLFRSADDGGQWSLVGMANQELGDLVMNQQGHLFLVAHSPAAAVLRSTDGGTTWEDVITGLSGSAINRLAVDSRGYVYATTEGGFYRTVATTASIARPLTVVTTGSHLYPNPMRESASLEFTLPKASHTTITVHSIDGRVVARLLDQMLPEGEHHVDFNTVNLPAGHYFYRIECDGQPAGGGKGMRDDG